MMKKTKIFSKRYKEIIEDSQDNHNDLFCGNIEFNVKRNISDILNEFAEPITFKPNRYDNYTVNTTALELAIQALNKELGYRLIDLNNPMHMYSPDFDPIAGLYTPNLFDLIELQYQELSKSERRDFEFEINNVFKENEVPWILHSGHLIKMDSAQFELDIKNKAASLLKELKDTDGKFAASYSELLKAIEYYNKSDYESAINSAEKSYESILKVIQNLNKGNADKLTSEWIKNNMLEMSSFNSAGFREKVLMSLPFIRNNTSAHGAGSKEVIIPKELANLAINLAATLDTYIIEEYKKSLSISNDRSK